MTPPATTIANPVPISGTTTAVIAKSNVYVVAATENNRRTQSVYSPAGSPRSYPVAPLDDSIPAG